MKPYRLINDSELNTLNQYFSKKLSQWNESYAIVPLQMQLHRPPKKYQQIQAMIIQNYHVNLALVEGDFLGIVKQGVFATDEPYLDASCHEFGLILINNLFAVEHCTVHHNTFEIPDWFYTGATCLMLTLSCKQKHFTLTVNPDWVYHQLPKPEISCPVKLLDEALAEHTIELYLDLLPSKLSIKNLARMSVGDIVSTNHPLTTTLKLIRKNELIAQAELGRTAQYKSIVLKRSL